MGRKILWTRSNESVPIPYYLTDTDDRVFHHLEYFYGGYTACDNNSRIANF
jgi:hypothetical protein